MAESFAELCSRLDRENAALDADPRFPAALQRYEAAGCREDLARAHARMEVKTGKPVEIAIAFIHDGDLVSSVVNEDGSITRDVRPAASSTKNTVTGTAERPAPGASKTPPSTFSPQAAHSNEQRILFA